MAVFAGLALQTAAKFCDFGHVPNTSARPTWCSLISKKKNMQVDSRHMIFRGLRVRMAVASGTATEVKVGA